MKVRTGGNRGTCRTGQSGEGMNFWHEPNAESALFFFYGAADVELASERDERKIGVPLRVLSADTLSVKSRDWTGMGR